jgi:hypothetical protein
MTDDIQKMLQHVHQFQPIQATCLLRFTTGGMPELRRVVKQLQDLRLIEETSDGIRTTEHWWSRLRQLNENAAFEAQRP